MTPAVRDAVLEAAYANARLARALRELPENPAEVTDEDRLADEAGGLADRLWATYRLRVR